MLKVENLTEGVKYSVENQEHIIDFGVTKVGKELVAKVLIDTSQLKNFSTKVTCGCSASEIVKSSDGKSTVRIEFKNVNSSKKFNKVIELKYSNKKDILRIKGEIQN